MLSQREGVQGGAVSTHKTFRVYSPDKTFPLCRLQDMSSLSPPEWPPGSGPAGQAPSVTREKGRAATPPPLFFQQNDRLLLDTRLADGISKGFREPSGVGTIIAKHASNKARRVTSWQERSKTNSIMFLRDSIFKKKNHQADKWVFCGLQHCLLLI